MHDPKNLKALNAAAEAAASGVLFIRSVNPLAASLFRKNAAARLLTQAEYLELLVELHEACKTAADHDDRVRGILEDCGLQEVTA